MDPRQSIPAKTIDAAPRKVRGPIVEDETVEGGVDSRGAAVIRPKAVPGETPASEGFRPTDPRPLND